MASPVNRTYLCQTRDAVELLGKLIRLGRKERKMTEEELSGRAGISVRTLQKIEHGDPKRKIGLVFEVTSIGVWIGRVYNTQYEADISHA